MAELEPLPYHRAVVAHLQQHLPAVWSHYASDAFRAEHEQAIRLHLLQTTFELKRESHPELYAVADEVAKALSLGVGVELYQGEGGEGLNAELLYRPNLARVVFYGPLQERLAPDELRCLLAHELAHHRLWTLDGGCYHIAVQALRGVATLGDLGSAHNALRLYALSTEVFADRAGLRVADLDAAVRLLVKVRTNLQTVRAADFLDQSEELHAATGTGSRGWTHPEAHIRALALRRYSEQGAEAEPGIRRLIEGPIQLDELDLLRRVELTELTHRLVGHLIAPTWFQTGSILGHTRMLLDDVVPEPVPPSDPEALLEPWGDSVREYLAAILLDYVAVDPDLGDLALARAHAVAEELGLEDLLVKAVNQKLKRRKREIEAALADRDGILAQADAQGAE